MATIKPSMANFAQDLVLKAFDSLAAKIEPPQEGADPSGLQKLSANWQSLTPEERQDFVGYVTSAAEVAAAAVPVVVAAAKKTIRRGAKRVVRRTAKKAPTAPVEPAAVQMPDKKKKDKDKKKKKHKKDKKDKKKKHKK